MRKARAVIGVVVVAGLVGCGAGRPVTTGPQVTGQRIAVAEFQTDSATVRYNEPVDAFGLAMAEEIAGALRKKGYAAEAFPAGREPRGDVVVRGRYLLIDGGSRALRYWVGFGAGAAKMRVEGDVTRSDGTAIGHFAPGRGLDSGSSAVPRAGSCRSAFGGSAATSPR
jgi:hypothetical protein